MRKPINVVNVPKVGDVTFDIFRSGQSFFEGTNEPQVKKWLLDNVKEAMEGKKGAILHPKQKEKFSADIQNQILKEIDKKGSIEFIGQLLSVLIEFWPDDAVTLFHYIEPQGEPVLLQKLEEVKKLFEYEPHRAQLGL